MEFTPEFIEQHKLSEEQVKGITPFIQEQFATKQKEWDGKANQNAEGIIDGAIKSIQKQFGLELEREQGEKAADYLTRFSSQVVGSKKAELDKLKADYEEKIKGVKGQETLAKEYESMKAEKEEILKKYADYDELKEKAKGFEEANQTLSTLKLEVAFNGIKPNFPETVNPYEAKAKWDEFKADVLSKYTIELVDGVPMAVDKENHYKTAKLSDLLSKAEDIQGLLAGRQQQGTGAKPADLQKIQGVPFDVPKGATAKERSELIAKHLATQGIEKASPKYAEEFAKLNTAILAGEKQAA